MEGDEKEIVSLQTEIPTDTFRVIGVTLDAVKIYVFDATVVGVPVRYVNPPLIGCKERPSGRDAAVISVIDPVPKYVAA